jgi:hypothetical protein
VYNQYRSKHHESRSVHELQQDARNNWQPAPLNIKLGETIRLVVVMYHTSYQNKIKLLQAENTRIIPRKNKKANAQTITLFSN